MWLVNETLPWEYSHVVLIIGIDLKVIEKKNFNFFLFWSLSNIDSSHRKMCSNGGEMYKHSDQYLLIVSALCVFVTL